MHQSCKIGTQEQQIVPLRQADQSKKEKMALVICESMKTLVATVCEIASVRENKKHCFCLVSCLPQGIQLSDFQHLADA